MTDELFTRLRNPRWPNIPDMQDAADAIERLRSELAAVNARADEKACECEFLRQELAKYVNYWRDRDLQAVTKERDAARADLAAAHARAEAAENWMCAQMQAYTKMEADLAAAREAMAYVRDRVKRINFLAGLDEPIREQASMAMDAIDAALAKDEGRT